MKKVFLFTCLSALALTFNSCSDDDSSSNNNNPGGTVSFKVDGVQKTFNTVTVHEDSDTFEGETYNWYEVTASNNGSATEMIYFEVEKQYVGAGAFDELIYTSGTDTYSMDWDSFVSNATSNTSSRLKGTFSGTVSMWDNNTQMSTEKEITNGTFDINP